MVTCGHGQPAAEVPSSWFMPCPQQQTVPAKLGRDHRAPVCIVEDEHPQQGPGLSSENQFSKLALCALWVFTSQP